MLFARFQLIFIFAAPSASPGIWMEIGAGVVTGGVVALVTVGEVRLPLVSKVNVPFVPDAPAGVEVVSVCVGALALVGFANAELGIVTE